MKYRNLNIEEIETFYMLSQVNDIDNLFNALLKHNGGWVLEAIEKRFSLLNLKVDKKILIAVLTLGDGIVGKCIKYVYDISKECNLRDKQEIEFEYFLKSIYPDKVPCF